MPLLGMGLGLLKSNRINSLSVLVSYSSIVAYGLDKINKNYNGYAIRVRRISDNAEQDIGFTNDTIDQLTLETFCSGTDGYIKSRYDQSNNNNNITITDTTKQQQIVSSGSMINLTDKRFCFEPEGSSISVVDKLESINSRIDNLNSKNYIVFRDNKSYTLNGYSLDYVTFIKCGSGLMDFGITNGDNVMWYLQNDVISALDRPAVTLGIGVSYLFADNILDNDIRISDNNTGSVYEGCLCDFSKLTYYLNLSNCNNATGNLSDINNLTYFLDISFSANIEGDLSNLSKLTYYLNIAYCVNITGNLSHLSNLTYYLNAINCTNITGDLSNLSSVTGFIILTNCNIYGILNPNPNLGYIRLAGTAMTPNDTDQTLINLDNNTITTGSIVTVGNRTSASDSAVTSLLSKGWTVT